MGALKPTVAVVRVAVTRAAAQADQLGQRLRSAGFEPVAVSHVLLDTHLVRRASA